MPTVRSGEAGTGTIGTAAGVAAFLVFLLFAVQLCVNLYAASTVTGAGYDAARTVAARRVDHDDPLALAAAQREAERQFRSMLGEAGRRARMDWDRGPDHIRLHVEVEAPAILPPGLASTAFGTIDRTFVVRIERTR